MPLAQLAALGYALEDGIIWRRNREPAVIVRADVYGKKQPATVVAELAPAIAMIEAKSAATAWTRRSRKARTRPRGPACAALFLCGDVLVDVAT